MYDVKIDGIWYNLYRVPRDLELAPVQKQRIATDSTKCPDCHRGWKEIKYLIFFRKRVICKRCYGTGVRQEKEMEIMND